jgi:hypothetical protein
MRLYDLLIEPLALWKFWIDMGSAACALGAGLFWLRASVVRTPAKFQPPNNFNVLDGAFASDVIDLANKLRKQSRLNALAAGFACAAAVLVALSAVIGNRWE